MPKNTVQMAGQKIKTGAYGNLGTSDTWNFKWGNAIIIKIIINSKKIK